MQTSGEVISDLCTAEWRLSEPKKCYQDCPMLTAQSLCGPWLRLVAYVLTYLWVCTNVKCGMWKSSNATEYDQAFYCVSTASDKHWSEKTWMTTPRCSSLCVHQCYNNGSS